MATDARSSVPNDRHTQMGMAAALLGDCDRARVSIGSMFCWLRMPIRLGQIVFAHNNAGAPVAFATWAWVCDATAARLSAGADVVPLPEDWNDGPMAWLVDVVAPYGDAHRLKPGLRDALGWQASSIGYASRREGGRRRIGWRAPAPLVRAA